MSVFLQLSAQRRIEEKPRRSGDQGLWDTSIRSGLGFGEFNGLKQLRHCADWITALRSCRVRSVVRLWGGRLC